MRTTATIYAHGGYHLCATFIFTVTIYAHRFIGTNRFIHSRPTHGFLMGANTTLVL
jgi:hypothetical protein